MSAICLLLMDLGWHYLGIEDDSVQIILCSVKFFYIYTCLISGFYSKVLDIEPGWTRMPFLWSCLHLMMGATSCFGPWVLTPGRASAHCYLYNLMVIIFSVNVNWPCIMFFFSLSYPFSMFPFLSSCWIPTPCSCSAGPPLQEEIFGSWLHTTNTRVSVLCSTTLYSLFSCA